MAAYNCFYFGDIGYNCWPAALAKQQKGHRICCRFEAHRISEIAEITHKVIVEHGSPYFEFSGSGAALYLLDNNRVDVPSFAECSATHTPNPTNVTTVAPLAGGPEDVP